MIIRNYFYKKIKQGFHLPKPINDIYFLKNLEGYEMDDKEIEEKTILKIMNHLWYLNEVCCFLNVL